LKKDWIAKMETLSYIVLILLSLVGFAAGATIRTGNKDVIEPGLPDIITILLVWTGAVFAKTSLDINRWLLILIWLALGFIIGMAAPWKRETSETDRVPKIANIFEPEKKPEKRSAWAKWKDFSTRMGGFQSRVWLSFFFFTVVMPFALLVRLFSDPLAIKIREAQSYWVAKKEAKPEIEHYKRQF
jgi:hypothetical protein